MTGMNQMMVFTFETVTEEKEKIQKRNIYQSSDARNWGTTSMSVKRNCLGHQEESRALAYSSARKIALTKNQYTSINTTQMVETTRSQNMKICMTQVTAIGITREPLKRKGRKFSEQVLCR